MKYVVNCMERSLNYIVINCGLSHIAYHTYIAKNYETMAMVTNSTIIEKKNTHLSSKLNSLSTKDHDI